MKDSLWHWAKNIQNPDELTFSALFLLVLPVVDSFRFVGQLQRPQVGQTRRGLRLDFFDWFRLSTVKVVGGLSRF